MATRGQQEQQQEEQEEEEQGQQQHQQSRRCRRRHTHTHTLAVTKAEEEGDIVMGRAADFLAGGRRRKQQLHLLLLRLLLSLLLLLWLLILPCQLIGRTSTACSKQKPCMLSLRDSRLSGQCNMARMGDTAIIASKQGTGASSALGVSPVLQGTFCSTHDGTFRASTGGHWLKLEPGQGKHITWREVTTLGILTFEFRQAPSSSRITGMCCTHSIGTCNPGWTGLSKRTGGRDSEPSLCDSISRTASSIDVQSHNVESRCFKLTEFSFAASLLVLPVQPGLQDKSALLQPHYYHYSANCNDASGSNEP